MAERDPLDINGDGVVVKEEVDAALGERPEGMTGKKMAFALGASPLVPGVSNFINYANTTDVATWEERKKQLYNDYEITDAPADGQTNSDTSVDANPYSKDIQNALGKNGGDAESTGYLGIDQLAAAGVIEKVEENGETVYKTRSGRRVLYKAEDPYRTLASMNRQELANWRKQMVLAGIIEKPRSYVGDMTTEDLKVMTELQTNANLKGRRWEDHIAPALERGMRYGRPLTEDELDKLEMRVPKVLSKYAAANGVSVSEDYIARQQEAVMKGKKTIDEVLGQFRDVFVKPLYPGWEKELDSGLTIEEVVSPYRSTAAEMLEMNEQDLTLNDPVLRSALQPGVSNDGAVNRVPLWEFKKQVAADKRWQYTDNARQTYESAADSLLNEMGF